MMEAVQVANEAEYDDVKQHLEEFIKNVAPS
jgi:hypothetical protein